MKRDANGNGHLTLELLAECPTDPASLFNQGRYKIDLYSSYLQDDSIEAYKLHGDAHSQEAETHQRELRQMEPLYYQELLRGYKSIVLDEGILNLNFSHLSSQTKRKLPRVEVITNFLIRREYYRNFDPRALSRIFQSLPRLESINLERWIHIKAADERRWNNRMLKSLLPMPHRLLPKGNDPGSSVLGAALPNSLKRLSLFAAARETFQKQSAMPAANPDTAKSLATLSQNLQQLSISFLVDAEDFFRSLYWPTSDKGGKGSGELHRLEYEPYWEHLTSLALTSKIFIMQETSLSLSTSRINDLLFAAAMTAEKMPKLEVMEIWNGDKGQAGIFRYVSTLKSTEIVWQGTQHLALSEQVLTAWREVALKNARHKLSVRVIPILLTRIEGSACVLDYLRLRKQVIHEVSAWQAQWEQRFRA
jgi:hypothetical protein